MTYTEAPDGRVWRIMTCWRGTMANRGQMVTELTEAHARKAHFDLYGPSTVECVIDGRSSQLAGLQELSQDLLLYRWNPLTARYECLFRGPIGRSQDTISETTHTVNLNASDYRAMLQRCITNQARVWTQADQASIAWTFMQYFAAGAGAPWDLGLNNQGVVNPDGTYHGATTGVLRDRTYTGAEKVGDMLDNLSQVINGFDYSLEAWDPLNAGGAPWITAQFYLWYPQRGIAKTFVAEYGSSVGSLTRTVNSVDFGNWIRNDGQNNEDGSPLFATALGDVMANPQLHAEGLWQLAFSHSDVSDQTTLQQQATGQLALSSILQPSYTVVLVPGAWNARSDCWLGDSIALRVRSGRLSVDTAIRIIQVDFDVDDNGQERIALTVGRSAVTFSQVMADRQSQIDALTRR
jgi:hypothetical protein